MSGTSVHAAEGTLAIMVGGDGSALERARPVLVAFSRSIHHIGGNGYGLVLKLITNRLLAAHLVGIAEAIVAMEGVGLDVPQGIERLRGSSPPRLQGRAAGGARLPAPIHGRSDAQGSPARRRGAWPRSDRGRHRLHFEEATSLGLSDDDVAAVMDVVQREAVDGLSR